MTVCYGDQEQATGSFFLAGVGVKRAWLGPGSQQLLVVCGGFFPFQSCRQQQQGRPLLCSTAVTEAFPSRVTLRDRAVVTEVTPAVISEVPLVNGFSPPK